MKGHLESMTEMGITSYILQVSCSTEALSLLHSLPLLYCFVDCYVASPEDLYGTDE